MAGYFTSRVVFLLAFIQYEQYDTIRYNTLHYIVEKKIALTICWGPGKVNIKQITKTHAYN